MFKLLRGKKIRDKLARRRVPKEKDIKEKDVKDALLNVMADLKESSARNEAILASIADGVIVIDRNSLITLMNRSAEKMIGWTARESIGKKWYQIIKPEDKNGNPIPPEKWAFEKAIINLTTTLPSSDNPQCFVRKDENKFPVSTTVSPIIVGKKAIGAVAIFRDITQEEEVDRMKDEFMDIAAHDLRSPATAIRGFISRVLDGDAGKISDKAKELLKEAYEGNMRLIYLIEDFLLVSRLERGKIKITPSANNLTEIIEDALNGFLAIAETKGLTLTYKKTQVPIVLVDKERIFQVINNLIDNAIKFTSKGEIMIWHEVQEGKVITHVTDTGIGISPETQQMLFQKYSKKEINRGGLGLGLYISKICVEGSGGKIWVKSQEGKGSTFSFSLPVAK